MISTGNDLGLKKGESLCFVAGNIKLGEQGRALSNLI